MYINLTHFLDCSGFECPNGSMCRVCNETGLAYCEFSCSINYGGCPEHSTCIETPVTSCLPGQCCSPINITCERKFNALHGLITIVIYSIYIAPNFSD